jgi:hypothetical protein
MNIEPQAQNWERDSRKVDPRVDIPMDNYATVAEDNHYYDIVWLCRVDAEKYLTDEVYHNKRAADVTVQTKEGVVTRRAAIDQCIIGKN